MLYRRAGRDGRRRSGHTRGGPTWLRAEALTLGYRRHTVVHGVDLELGPGRVTALVGPNGSGKSTVLRSLARVHPMEAGRARLRHGGDGWIDTASLDARAFARQITMLSQSRPEACGLTVRDVVAFGRHPHRHRFAALAERDREAIARALALSGLVLLADRPVEELSGGERQRVWLAACLAQDTRVLLLDEPTNHLDLRYQVEVLTLIRDLADDHGVAVGVVLHDLDQAAAVADEIVLLHAGRVRVAGPPAQVLRAEHLTAVYGLELDVRGDPDTGALRIETPIHHRRRRPTLPLPEGTR